MTHTRANISVKLLQRELGVTYKTAWRMYDKILLLMEQNNGDLLSDAQVRKWVFFNKIELKVVQKKQESLSLIFFISDEQRVLIIQRNHLSHFFFPHLLITSLIFLSFILKRNFFIKIILNSQLHLYIFPDYLIYPHNL
jgi:hypothetical protein